ncbi:MAG TPA: efflux transporter periplasmic adaptor subunit, partial [Methylophilus sp.]|nr:efflux transporter periplasmic adaptor subunit [Methylophilus sp.]
MSRILISTLFTAALAVMSTACSEKPAPAPETKAVVDPNLVTLTPELEANIKIGTVGEVQFVDTLRIPGRIQVDEQYES